MEERIYYEKFPSWIPVLANTVSIAIYVIGAYILAGFGILWAIFYLFYGILIEFSVLKWSCVDCYYYGKICAFGKGKLCALLFKKGDPQKFIEKDISWYHLLPDFLIVIIPLVGGIARLIMNFTWSLMILILVLFVLFFVGNAIIRGSLACKHCKQGELGCPAARMFLKENGNNV